MGRAPACKPLQASRRKKTDDTMTMKFLLHKDRKEKGKPTAQKQECGCPSLQPSLRSHTLAFSPAHSKQDNNNGEGNHPKMSQKQINL